MENGQKRSLNNQDQLIKGSQQLQDHLQSAREEVSSAFNDMQHQAWSLKNEFHEIFLSLSTGLDHIQLMLNWLLGVFINFECVVVFIVSMVTSHLLTCNKFTAGARPIMMGIVVIQCVIVERLLVWWYLRSMNMDTESDMGRLHFVMWIARYAMALLCLGVLVHSYCSYRHYEAINHQLINKTLELEAVNHQLLKKIIKQNHQIKKHFNLETEEIVEDKWPVISTPAQPVIPQPTRINSPTGGGVISTDIHRNDQESVDEDQPDSEYNPFNKTTCRYNFRKRCHRSTNKILEHETAQQFTNLVLRRSRRLSKGHNT